MRVQVLHPRENFARFTTLQLWTQHTKCLIYGTSKIFDTEPLRIINLARILIVDDWAKFPEMVLLKNKQWMEQPKVKPFEITEHVSEKRHFIHFWKIRPDYLMFIVDKVIDSFNWKK